MGRIRAPGELPKIEELLANGDRSNLRKFFTDTALRTEVKRKVGKSHKAGAGAEQGRTFKEEQKEISLNHVPTIILNISGNSPALLIMNMAYAQTHYNASSTAGLFDL